MDHCNCLVLFAGIFLLLSAHRPANGEVYTALVDMEKLMETEALLMNTLHGYIHVMEDKLDILRRRAEEYHKEHAEASRDIQGYLSNPLNAYLLVKRLTTDWKQVESLMSDDVGKDFIENITNYRDDVKFPSDEDLNGAAVALMRLQDTYQLDTASLARGEINGVQYSTELTAGDCFELGRQSYNNQDYYHTVLWMREADLRLEREVNKTTTKEDILEYLAFSVYMEGNIPMAMRLTKELLEITPTHQRARGNLQYYETEIKNTIPEKRRGDDESLKNDMMFEEAYTIRERKSRNVEHLSERELYETLCRGEVGPSLAAQAQLKCRYVRKSDPFTILAPFKEEEASLKPRIVIYHDVIYDNEIETIQEMARPRFKRATVQNHKTGALETAHYRISKSAWLKEHEHKHIAQVCQRVKDITQLTLTTAEELQVVNYGIGGHYEPHFDFARKEERNAFKSLGTGNRIATVLFYMSDVAQGGATVFPAVRTALWPKKGTAAFWFNLHPNGEGDYLTRHAACPVLAGSKWVSNKWIHERGQEFLRPCGLQEDPIEPGASGSA